jgi:hypothetical protein
MTRCHQSNNLSTNSNVFGELNLAAIELDSLRTSLTSSSYSSSSSSSINNEKYPRKPLFLVWHEYENYYQKQMEQKHFLLNVVIKYIY